MKVRVLTNNSVNCHIYNIHGLCSDPDRIKFKGSGFDKVLVGNPVKKFCPGQVRSHWQAMGQAFHHGQLLKRTT
jgi:hypothetical protein